MEKRMSGLFQVELQFWTLGGTTEIDPSHIPEYSVSERLRGIEGQNIIGQPWDVLHAAADRAQQANERGMALEMTSQQTGVPIGHIYAMDQVDPHLFERVRPHRDRRHAEAAARRRRLGATALGAARAGR